MRTRDVLLKSKEYRDTLRERFDLIEKTLAEEGNRSLNGDSCRKVVVFK